MRYSITDNSGASNSRSSLSSLVAFFALLILLASTRPVMAASEINIQQPPGTLIADGGTRSFGSITLGGNATLTFRLENTGNTDLTLTGTPRVSVSGTHATDFTVTAQPVSPVGAVSLTNASFEIPDTGVLGISAPSGTGWTFGDLTGVISSSNSPEGDQAAFILGNQAGSIIARAIYFPAAGAYRITFSLAKAAAFANPIEVRMDGTPLGTVVPSNNGWLSAGVTYNVPAAGIHTLAFAGLLGDDSGSLIDNVKIAHICEFQVRFAPTAAGLRTATLSIPNNDSDENPYDITLTGTGLIRSDISIESPSGSPLTNGMVVVWGANGYGQTNVPAGLENVKAIGAGVYFAVALKADGTVASWGLHTQAGVPTDLTNAVSVAAGDNHTLALRSDGTVVAWGVNLEGETIVPPGLTDVAAIAAGGKSSAALRSNGTVVTWGYLKSEPPGVTNAIAIAQGTSHALALRSDGTVVAWGQNNVGQTNVPVGLTGVVAITAADYGSAAVKSDGTIVQWGDGVPEPPGLSGVSALAVAEAHALALRNDATIVAWGSGFFGQATVLGGLMGVRAVAANGQAFPNDRLGHSVALLDSTVKFGNVILGAPAPTRTFTIRNTGPDPLTISSVNTTDGDSARFTVNTTGMLTTIPANGTTTFSASFLPGILGEKHTTLRVASNDPDEGTFYIHLTGTVVAVPEISVFTGANTNAANARTNNVGINVFANTTLGASSAAQTFTIQNVGTTNLTGLELTKAGANTADFTLSDLGATTLAPNATTTFTVTFAPTAAGTRSAVVNMASSDGDENPFSIHVRGAGVAVPEISVFTGANTDAANTRTDNVGTNVFATTTLGASSAPQTFTIQNVGSANLNNLAVGALGANIPDFTLGPLGTRTLAPNATTTFTVTFAPTAAGTRSAVVNIYSNDGDEYAFDIQVRGTGVAVPEISVFTGANTNAANARTDNVGTDVFANTTVGARSATQTFTIKNVGSTNLTGLALSKGGANTADFTLSALGTTTLAPNVTTTFTVTFAPTATGTCSAVVKIASNDGDENPFSINVSGLGTTEASALIEASIPGDTIAATSANFPAAQTPEKASDNNVTTKYLNFDKLNTGLTITPTGHRPVQALTLISAEDAPERDPLSFVLEGSDDGTNFTRLASNAVPAFSTRHFVQSVAVANTNVFNSYRVLFPTISNAAAANSMQIAEVELLFHGEITSLSDAVSITLSAGAVDVRGVGSLFDRQLDGIRKLEVALLTNSSTIIDIIPAAGATVLKGFELIGAADDFSYPQRRPSSVVVAGSNDGVNYTNLATVVPAAPASNLQIQEFATPSNNLAFANYRITFGPPVGGDRLQVGEMRLFGEAAPAILPPPILSVRSSGNNLLVSWTNNPGFALEMRTDLSDTNWTTVATAPVLSNGVNTVTLPAAGDASFFRLRK